MKLKWPPPGKYTLAVSGGIDSVVLLDLFATTAERRGYELVVAHFDHAMRDVSATDSDFVRSLAGSYGLGFVSERSHIVLRSEAEARTARYNFLERVKAKTNSIAIITAHHQDDLIETSLLNLARGTGRRGATPFEGAILRPLTAVPKADIIRYAQTHSLVWSDDATNSDIENPRNFLRHQLLSAATSAWRSSFLDRLNALTLLNNDLNHQYISILAASESSESKGEFSFDRHYIRSLSLLELAELLVAAAKLTNPAVELERRHLAELAIFCKISQPGKYRPLTGTTKIVATRDCIKLQNSN